MTAPVEKGSRNLFRQWDAAHVWHPFTQMQEYLATEPLMVVAAEGHYLIDDLGRRLFDGTSALWCNLFGHRVPEIDAAITEQLGRFAHTTLLGTTHPAVAELAKALVEVAPKGLNHVFFSDNGATAVEAALKIAFQYRLLTQGKAPAEEARYLSLDNAYHGDTLGAAAVGGVELFHDIFRPIMLPSLKTPSPYCYRCPIGKTPADCSVDCADDLEQALARAEGRVCAVILEPGVQAAAGMLVLPKGFLTRAAAACRKHGALLILDEVATGFGRTGSLFACQHEGVTPDIILPSIYDYLEIGESHLENALEADHIQPADYHPLNQVKQYVPELQKNSKERIAKSKDFALAKPRAAVGRFGCARKTVRQQLDRACTTM